MGPPPSVKVDPVPVIDNIIKIDENTEFITNIVFARDPSIIDP